MKLNQFKNYLILISITMLLWFTIHSVVIVMDGLHDELSKTDIGVVLGNKVELNGKPSERLKARLDKADELYTQGYFSRIIVSGGVGEEGFDEAEVMKEYLINQGIPENNILADSEGYNTSMTAENAKAITEELNLESVTVITQYYHITRTELAFKKAGFDTVRSAHAEIVEIRDPYSIIREFFAFYKYLID